MVAHMLDVFNRRCLHAIPSISWRDHVTNEEVMSRHGATPRHCYNKEKENGWPSSQTAHRNTNTYSYALGAIRRQKKEGEAEEEAMKMVMLILVTPSRQCTLF